MSASDKKKLRKEQVADFLTEKQRQEQAEAKKLKVYTITFITAMILVVVIALGVLGVRAVNNSGVIQKNTIAATVEGNSLSSVEMSYYYNDAVNQYYSDIQSQFTDYADSYLQAMGLETGKPLDEQVKDTETGKTWAEFFLESALDQAKIDYAMYALATDDYELPEDAKSSLDNLEANITTYATLYGYSNADQYLRAMYGYGADLKSYTAYCRRGTIATAYITDHHDSLTYDDAAIRAYETDKKVNYTSFTYDSVYMSYTEFLQGGTTAEDGSKTYSDEDNNAARAAVKAAAEAMATANTLDELKAKAAEITLNDDTHPELTAYKNDLYTNINGTLSTWLADASRKEGDIAAIPNESTTKNDDGTETTVVNGYYVVCYQGRDENLDKVDSVRHLLVQFECEEEGEHDHENYSDAEKAKAKEEADGYLKTWLEGEKTEESFIELVKKHSDDSSASEGGLYENIYSGSNYVPNFLNWATSADRKVGDAEVIETEYGYHVMYYVGEGELSARDYMISTEMRDADHEKWYNEIVEAATASLSDTSKMRLDLTLS